MQYGAAEHLGETAIIVEKARRIGRLCWPWSFSTIPNYDACLNGGWVSFRRNARQVCHGGFRRSGMYGDTVASRLVSRSRMASCCRKGAVFEREFTLQL